MVTRLAKQARVIVRQAEKEAAAAGSPVTESEHLLLAMAAVLGTEAQRVLASAGLDRDSIRDALDREMRQSLGAAGVVVPPGGLPWASQDPARRARIGASSKLALQRALKAATGQRQIRPGHLLLGVLGAQAGTVPRALVLAGADQRDLTARARLALAIRTESSPGDGL
jgi:D-alanyl-D-alanine carboxypeptidase